MDGFGGSPNSSRSRTCSTVPNPCARFYRPAQIQQLHALVLDFALLSNLASRGIIIALSTLVYVQSYTALGSPIDNNTSKTNLSREVRNPSLVERLRLDLHFRGVMLLRTELANERRDPRCDLRTPARPAEHSIVPDTGLGVVEVKL